VMVNALSFM
jgi:hypothetical protein